MSEEPNPLLGQKIDSLKELMDVKFTATNETLKRIEGSTQSFVTRLEFEENKKDSYEAIKYIKDALVIHYADDKKSFGDLKKIAWIGIGILSAVIFSIQYIIPLWLSHR